MSAAASAPPPAQASAPGALWSPSDAAPIRPPPAVRHPLRLLEEFLASVDREEEEEAKINQDDDADEDQQQKQQSEQPQREATAAAATTKIQRVLRVADFLYGGDSNSSSARGRTVLDNALEVLDGGAGYDAGVRCYRAKPSGRVAYVVRGSGRGGVSNNNNGGNVGGVGAGGGGSRSSGDYLCFLHEMAGSPSSSSSSSDGTDGGCFCPCRSFFERTKADRRAVCKHLLAARLGPYLQTGYGEYEVSDVQFAQIVLQHSFLPAG